MKRSLLPLLTLAAAATSGLAITLSGGAAHAQAPAAIEVVFVNPENFSDLRRDRMTSDRERAGMVADLRAWLEREAPRRLPAGTRLAVTITDIDMAGEFEPQRGIATAHVRIVRDIYPARVTLSFRLADASGKTLKEGARRLSSAGFFVDTSRGRELLGYEKAVLEEWLAREFA